MKDGRFILDPIFCRKFVGVFTRGGKRSRALKLLRFLLYRSRREDGGEAIIALGLKNITPKVSWRSRKKGSVTYKIPFPLRKNEALACSVRWLAKAVSQRKERDLSTRIYAELKDASNCKGRAFQRCSEFHSLVLYNRGFIRFLR